MGTAGTAACGVSEVAARSGVPIGKSLPNDPPRPPPPSQPSPPREPSAFSVTLCIIASLFTNT